MTAAPRAGVRSRDRAPALYLCRMTVLKGLSRAWSGPNRLHPAYAGLMALAAVCGLCRDVSALQQPLQLAAAVGKGDFFEGEPIYAAFRLTNVGIDTAWLGSFELMPGKLDARLTRSDGVIVPHQTVWVDYAFDPKYRGQPLPPGESRFLLIVLQDQWGVPPRRGEGIFHWHLPAGQYALTTRFNPRVESRPDPNIGAVVAPPVSIRVRPRAQSEETSFQEVARVMEMCWDRAQRSQFLPALGGLAERRLKADPADPYLAYLLNEGVVMAIAADSRVDSAQGVRFTDMRLAVASARRMEPSGALAAQAAFLGAPDMTPRLSDRLGPSLAADAIRPLEAHADRYLHNLLRPSPNK